MPFPWLPGETTLLARNGFRLWKSLNWPNRISLLRLLLVAPFVLLMMNQAALGAMARYGGLGVFVAMALSDFVDGQLARRLNLRTRLGAILDPLADKVLIICSTVLLSLPGTAVQGYQIPSWVVVAVVGKDLWVLLGFVVVYLVTDRFRVHPTWAGKFATFGQLVMVIAVLVGPDLDRVAAPFGAWLAQTLMVAVAILSILAVISYTRLGLLYVVSEQKPLHDGPEFKKVDGLTPRAPAQGLGKDVASHEHHGAD